MKRAYDLMCALSYAWNSPQAAAGRRIAQLKKANDFIEVETVEGWFWLDHFAG